MSDKTASRRSREPYDVRHHPLGYVIMSGPTDNDVILGAVYDKGPGSGDPEEMAKVWAASYQIMFPALANIRNVASRAATTDRYETMDGLRTLLAAIAKTAGDALPVPTIGDLNGTSLSRASSPAPAAPSQPAQGDSLTETDNGSFDAALRLLRDASYFARRWSSPKAVADYIDEQMEQRGLSASPTPPAPDAVSKALSDITAERRRQIEVEGWTPEHDDQYSNGGMATAAACYILNGVGSPNPAPPNAFPTWWPWASRWWKPKDRRSDLIRAAALIAAEIERLDRAALRSSKETSHG